MHAVIDHDLSRRDLKRWLALFPKDSEKRRPALLVAHSFAIETGDPLSMQMSNLIQIRRAMFSRNGLKDAAPYTPTSDSTWVWLLYPSLVHAEYLVNRRSRQNCSAGLELVEKGLQMARHHHNTRLEIQFLAVKAVTLKCAGRLNEALAV